MLKIVLLSALLVFAVVVAAPEAAANNICQDSIVADNTHNCNGAGPCWREGLRIVCQA